MPLRIMLAGDDLQTSSSVAAANARALRALGHAVFEIDLQRHHRATRRWRDDPLLLAFDPNPLSAAFDEFRPHLLVVASGRVGLTEEVAGWLRERGVASVGLPASATQASMVADAWFGGFDRCLAPSSAVAAAWLERGANDTDVLPPSVDRAWVLHRVQPHRGSLPDLITFQDADPATPDVARATLDFAGRLEGLNVRVVGEAWPVPGAAAHSIDERVQLARGVDAHLALSGGTPSIARGVFESIAAGAVLFTDLGSAVEEFFVPGTEIVRIAGPEDLVARLAELRSRPNAFEELRTRAFASLVDHHLLEDRWLAILERMVSSDTWASADAFSDVLRSVIISGFYGARNRGDDLLLNAVVSALRAADPRLLPVVAGVDARAIEEDYGFQSFEREDLVAAERFAAEAAAIVLGPGGLWHDYSIADAGGIAGMFGGARVSPAHLAQLPLMVRAYGGTLHVIGMGVGPLRDQAARAAVRLVGSLADAVTLRDEESLAWLDGIRDAWSVEPRVAPDPVFALELPPSKPSEAPEEPYIVLNLRPWGDGSDVDRLRRGVLATAARLGLAVVTVPMEPIDVASMTSRDGDPDVKVSAMPVDASLAELVGVIEGARAVVSMRLHACLLAHRLTRPTIGLSYDRKVNAHFAQLGRESWLLPLTAKAGDVGSLLRAALVDGALSPSSTEAMRMIETTARNAMAEFANTLAKSAVRGVPAPAIGHQPERRWLHGPPIDVAQESRIDLTAAHVYSGSASHPGAVVHHVHEGHPSRCTFGFAARAPKAGDFVEWELCLPAAARSSRVEIVIRQTLREQAALRGYIHYSVRAGGEELFRQDIGAWRPENAVWVTLPGGIEPRNLSVRLLAERDCPDWNWGVASKITIARARELPWDGNDLSWGASSPLAASARSHRT
ncbi:polysaccharide pyruvyl transferase family protein [Agrococcus carbonis]|nr:polysaccharide pyruvyl transferase family protein [Agrococcus carbonis]